MSICILSRSGHDIESIKFGNKAVPRPLTVWQEGPLFANSTRGELIQLHKPYLECTIAPSNV